jgi:predicted nucleotide-binding protein
MTEPLKILVADDDPFWVKELSDILQDEGFQAVPAESPAEVMAILSTEQFHGVVLDLRMKWGIADATAVIDTSGGWLAGLVLARKIRQQQPAMKLVAVTADNDSKAKEWFSRDNTVGYLQKTERPAVLAQKLRRILLGELPRPFIVHGRDLDAVRELKDYLQNTLHFPHPTVLWEEPTLARTLIEKFEEKAAFAELVFILLTPDDVGAFSGAPSNLQGRARQNAIFELGFFLGYLGRGSGRVILLAKGDLEIPSDLWGVFPINFINGISSAGEEIRRSLSKFISNGMKP